MVAIKLLNNWELNGLLISWLFYEKHFKGKTLEYLLSQDFYAVTEAAKSLGVTRKTLSELLNGHSRISPEMAIRLSIVFQTSAESWINQQAKYDLWLAEKTAVNLK